MCADFTWTSSQTITFDPGEKYIRNIVNIVNDEAIESTESLTISLTNPQPPDAVLSLGSTTIIIINDDFRKFLFCFTTFAIENLCMCAPSTAHIRFEQERYTTSEAAGSIDVCITVLTGPVIDSLTVAIEMMPSSATGKQKLIKVDYFCFQ